ncbi:alpha/beta fold hydrolase [Scytonema millei]|uniref:Alpha/beta fold hydrolase n=1 Tax=Scytonema millei VB511283 TaxID=1245923 RepID=A0A9X5E582_9CYAN|nr:alpha/beta fold hydrolase [Scytonema millei]NHC35028.1 alpha/beta fold hydrolase [Scytonema millei VB511283]
MQKTQVPIDRYVKVGSINIRYWMMGSENPIILLHGGQGSVEFWLYNIGTLAKSNCVYALDMVGSGRSDKPQASYSLTYQAQFIKDFMDTLEIESATLIGNSMGGGAALQLALLFPQRVNKLVLVDSMGFGREIALGIRLTTLPLLIRLLRPSRRLLAPMLKNNFFNPQSIPSEWIELRYPIFALPGRKPALMAMVKTNFHLLGVRSQVFRPILSQLATITAPTLIIWGKQDRIIPVAHAYIAAKTIPNARLHIFDRCGHHPHLEYPEKFNNLVLEFLAFPSRQ